MTSTPQPKKLIQFDWAIKTLLRNRKNFSILEGFLSELLRTDVKIKELLESESNKSHAKDKSNRVDMAARLGNGEHVIIEVQSVRQDDFITRMLYGVSKVVVDYLQEGDRYHEVPRVISVNIVYFDLGEGNDYIYHGTTEFRGIHKRDVLQLQDSEKKHYPDHIANIFPEYYVLKVSAFDLHIRDTLDEWMYALKKSEVRPEFKAKGIQEAGNVLTRLNLSQEELAVYERYITDARNARSEILTAFDDGEALGIKEGLAKGLAEGRVEAKVEMIRSFHQLGIALEQIAMAAKLSCEEVQAILKNK
ncbi:MAG: Rpn family recombination-promoting nuclease/putative transposase [Chthoniobacterales bacterium]|nr:Rpn family recombination-promoting nuclease/putative transposase [Chthoniobacterales bacterium]